MLRQLSPEGSLSLRLFLKGIGPLWARLPGAARGSLRFGGATEPLVWGTFQLYQSPKGVYMKEAEVKEDFWTLRQGPTMMTALRWAKWLHRFLLERERCDDVLALFYWAMKALQDRFDAEAVQARFLWRWLLSWGSAPDLSACGSCGRLLQDRGWFYDGALLCSGCAGEGAEALDLDQVAPYVMAPRFLPTSGDSLRGQCKNLSKWLLKTLETYR